MITNKIIGRTELEKEQDDIIVKKLESSGIDNKIAIIISNRIYDFIRMNKEHEGDCSERESPEISVEDFDKYHIVNFSFLSSGVKKFSAIQSIK